MDRLLRGIGGDGEVYGAFGAGVVSGAKELSLRRVGVVGRSDRAATAGGGHGAVDEARLVDREVGEAYRLPGEGVSERGDVNDCATQPVADVVGASLPADEVFDVLDDDLNDVGVVDSAPAGR